VTGNPQRKRQSPPIQIASESPDDWFPPSLSETVTFKSDDLGSQDAGGTQLKWNAWCGRKRSAPLRRPNDSSTKSLKPGRNLSANSEYEEAADQRLQKDDRKDRRGFHYKKRRRKRVPRGNQKALRIARLSRKFGRHQGRTARSKETTFARQ